MDELLLLVLLVVRDGRDGFCVASPELVGVPAWLPVLLVLPLFVDLAEPD